MPDPGRERLFRIVVQDRNGGLNDDGACVCPFVNEVNGASGDLHSVLKRLALRVKSGKSREKRRMDIHDREGKSIEENRRYDPHETGENNETNAMFPELFDKRGIVLFATGKKPVIQEESGDTMPFGALQCECIGVVGDYAGNLRPNGPSFNPVNNSLKVRAVSGGKDANIKRFGHQEVSVAHDRRKLNKFHRFGTGFTFCDFTDDKGLLVEP